MPQKSSSLYTLGRPFSPIYSLLMKIRATAYRNGLKRRYKIDVPVISVGNLTMGGTGKTPIVGFLASMLQEHGFKPAIISRGYGGVAGNRVNVVSDGETIFLDAATAGDEPRLLAEKCPGVPVLTGIVRVLPCRHAVETFGSNVLILDDAFSHLSVQRDLDLVLFSGANLAGNSRVFPGGDLREPVTALKRADAFVLTGVTDDIRDRCLKFKELLSSRFPDIPVFFTSYHAESVTDKINGESKELSSLPTPLFAFCGIGLPELFQKTLTAEGISPVGFLPFKDHQKYTPLIIRKIIKHAEKLHAEALITTEKDLTKLTKTTLPIPCFGMKMKVGIDDDFKDYLLSSFSAFSIPDNPLS